MRIEQIKHYIMTVLYYKKDNLAICPTLIIDRLFDGLDHKILPEMASYAQWGPDKTNMQKVWDRYLMPELAQDEDYMNVKIFAR